MPLNSNGITEKRRVFLLSCVGYGAVRSLQELEPAVLFTHLKSAKPGVVTILQEWQLQSWGPFEGNIVLDHEVC